MASLLSREQCPLNVSRPRLSLTWISLYSIKRHNSLRLHSSQPNLDVTMDLCHVWTLSDLVTYLYCFWSLLAQEFDNYAYVLRLVPPPRAKQLPLTSGCPQVNNAYT